MKSVVVDPAAYDWEGDAPLRRPSARTIIYEMHVRGFTRHPSSGVTENIRGTYAGLIEKIPYLQGSRHHRGRTAAGLPRSTRRPARPGLVNYWGYQPVSFFAPHPAYSSRRDPLGPVDEFRDMVKALHRAGIEVILDVVFNHTAEGEPRRARRSASAASTTRPTTSSSRTASRYADYTGCGNTLNANHPVVRRMIVDSLRYWVTEMHVDGFRFDLASILSRDSIGQPLPEPAGALGHRVGPGAGRHQADRRGVGRGRAVPGRQLRRRRLEGVERPVPRRRPRLLPRRAGCGGHASPTGCSAAPKSTATRSARPSRASTSSPATTASRSTTSSRYNEKHNEANGEENRDGANDNQSWNCGVEGPTDDPAIEELRNRQVKNFLTVTLLSLGVPMILMGDEVRRTQGGNNNVYCHDNEANWFDWSLLEKHADVHRFVKLLLAAGGCSATWSTRSSGSA